MDIHGIPEHNIITDPRYTCTAEKLSGNTIKIHQRRQDKIIAALIRRNPRLVLEDSVTLTQDERKLFVKRSSEKRLDRWKDTDYMQALSAVPLPITSAHDMRNPKELLQKISTDTTTNRRMKRIIAYITKGSLLKPGEVTSHDLYSFIQYKCKNAVAFERMIPHILKATDLADLGANNYKQALNELGILLYGSQWIYLQQIRLAEQQAKQILKTTPVAPPVRTHDPDSRDIPTRERAKKPRQQNKKSILSRRNFLRLALLAGGVMAVKVAPEPVLRLFNVVQDSESQKDKVESLGLHDFVDFYNSVIYLQQDYVGKMPLNVQQGDTFQNYNKDHDPYYILQKILNPPEIAFGYRYEDPALLDRLKNGWGEKKAQAVTDARDKISNTLNIVIANGLTDTTDSIKKFCTLFANLLPAYILQSPQLLQITDGAGEYSGSDPGSHIYIPSPSKFSLEQASVAYFHELSHSEINWEAAKPYIDRKSYANYLSVEANAIHQVLDTYFPLSWQDAQTWNGGSLFSAFHPGWDDSQIMNRSFNQLEHDLASVYGIDMQSLQPVNTQTGQNPGYQFNKLMWAVGNHRASLNKQIRQNNGTLDGVSDSDKAFLQDADINTLLARAVGEMDHYFRGPVQKSGGGFPGNIATADNEGSLLTQLNKSVQQAKLKVYSTLPQNVLSDFITSSQAIRDALTI